MLLSSEEHYIIVLSAIRDYESGVNDVGILIVEKIISQISSCVTEQITTQDIFDEIIEVFNYYNDFITEKKLDLKTIPDEMIDLVEIYINEVVKDVTETKKEKEWYR